MLIKSIGALLRGKEGKEEKERKERKEGKEGKEGRKGRKRRKGRKGRKGRREGLTKVTLFAAFLCSIFAMRSAHAWLTPAGRGRILPSRTF